MKHIVAVLLLVALFDSSCSSILSKKTPHEKYAEKLDDNDLEKTVIGRQWLAASEAALTNAQAVQLPYKQLGYFHMDKPRALGLKFTAKRGEQLQFTLSKKAPTNFVIYADVFKQSGAETSHMLFADTTSSTFTFDVDESGTYLLRLQPELFRTGEYSLSVAVGPSIGFPVQGSKAKAGSFWGASRDGGKRSHEGIDIFAPKLTPVVAAADGVITGVKEGGIGGKVVWLRVNDKNYTLYYAHLHKQLVEEGQTVKKGDVLGLVGNTGNAKNTPSHLHFGVYTFSGPIDPYPFVNPIVKLPEAVPPKNLNNYLRVTKTGKLGPDKHTVTVNTLLVPLAVTAKGYIAELPDGKITQTPFTTVQPGASLIKNTIPVASVTETKKAKQRKGRG